MRPSTTDDVLIAPPLPLSVSMSFSLNFLQRDMIAGVGNSGPRFDRRDISRRRNAKGESSRRALTAKRCVRQEKFCSHYGGMPATHFADRSRNRYAYRAAHCGGNDAKRMEQM
jgi:hypothetical protein